MKSNSSSGFSLIEILVSLMIVSLVAINISSLQKIVGDQNRDNSSHSLVIDLMAKKFEEVMQMNSLQEVTDLDGSSSTLMLSDRLFTLAWNVKDVSEASNVSSLRDVELSITWSDAVGETQISTYSKHVSLTMLNGEAGDFSYAIPNLLNTNQVSYFESKMGYKKDAYVIYDSKLFQSTAIHSVGNGHPRNIDPPISQEGVVASGWDNLGRIDDASLADLFID